MNTLFLPMKLYSILILIFQAGDCPGGYYCPEGTGDQYVNPCPAGFYLNASAGESSQGCTPCISGYYCDESGLAWPKDCPQVSFRWHKFLKAYTFACLETCAISNQTRCRGLPPQTLWLL